MRELDCLEHEGRNSFVSRSKLGEIFDGDILKVNVGNQFERRK